ncbi:conserved hypothetical protein [Ferrimonas balearica DSM 9799]|uniref:Lipoprotein n=1 Tax=Ferrimonas balearica (strain DSM 9799 / CCM 4581 / KCTC 23876 / PAT) TaxID=550540 RepID=E1SV08_FERBD|nr:DUF3332 domain-containing protein [Ferrimonas balearica]ADN76335.1 conserved hypothetical protein [Ferrimonas balearica DSM 9799]MBY5980858.1 DUF3332 domain-containing protein [Ferrimonas balearica]
MKKLVLSAVAVALTTSSLTGCMGQMGVSAAVTKANLSVVDNRYGRAGLFMLMSPVYGIASMADLFIFNSIEFWTGTNPITGRSPAVVDMPVEAIFKVNQHLDSSLTENPNLDQKLQGKVERIQMEYLDQDSTRMNLFFEDGSERQLLGQRMGDRVEFSLDGEAIATVSVAELEAYVETRQS